MIKLLLAITLIRPLKMLFMETIVASWALYCAFVFGVLFAFFDSYPYMFINVYGFTFGRVDLAFLGILVGTVLAVFTFVVIEMTISKKKRRLAAPGKPAPEDRLYASMLGAFGIPISLFWFAWTARDGVNFMCPDAAGVLFGWGTVTLFSGPTYLLDTYGAMYGASAVAANGLLRYCFDAAFPLFTLQMYDKLGIGWATSVLGFIRLMLLPILFVLYRSGPALQARNVFT